MALTRAQLLSGDAGQGVVLTGQVRGVKPGPGIIIGTDGVIEVDSQSIQGVMRLGQTTADALAAFNGYKWPTSIPGVSGGQLTVDTSGNLTWSDADGIPWTAKGQLIVGTGAGTDTLLNVGGNTSFLIADSGTTSGLIYSGSSTSAAQMPAGNGTTDRPSPGSAGQIRFNTDTKKFEFNSGTGWEQIASGDPAVSTFVKQTVPSAPAGATGNAVIPAGTTLQRQTAPAVTVGQLRYNTTDNEFEGYGGSPAAWGPLGGVPTGAAGDKIFFLNSQVITANYTLPTVPLAKNSVTAGPITINAGVTVTVPAGQSWSIV
jgi:hypothetical protein